MGQKFDTLFISSKLQIQPDTKNMELILIDRYMEIIKQCPLFDKVPDSELRRILEADDTRLIRVDRSRELTNECMYVVIKGFVHIEKAASDGRYITMRSAGVASPINVAGALGKKDENSRLTASRDGRLLCISGKTLERSIRKGGQLAYNIVDFLSERIYFLNKKIVSLAGYTAASRLNMYIEENRVGNEVIIPMSLAEFAEYLGVGRASLYRTLDALESSGKIERKGRKITITEDRAEDHPEQE